MRIQSERDRDRLQLGIGLDTVAAGLAAEAGLLVNAEGERRVSGRVDVAPHHAGAKFRGHLVNGRDVASPDRGGEAVGGVGGGLGHLVERKRTRLTYSHKCETRKPAS